MKKKPTSVGRSVTGFGFAAFALSLHAVEPNRARTQSGELLLTGPLGELETLGTDVVPAALLPPAKLGLRSQIPTPGRGTEIPEQVQRRLDVRRADQRGFEWFPSAQPRLMSYLGAHDEFGNTAINPGPLISNTPIDVIVQQGKYWFSEVGLRYALDQSFTFVSMSDVMQGDNALGFYTLNFEGKWAVFSTADTGTAGWISAQIGAEAGIGDAGRTQSAQRNLGSLTDPTGIWSGVNGVWIQELAWQQSFLNGEFVALIGIINQGNYLDANRYANNGRGQFLNSALINSMVLPLPSYNPGINLQWQPNKDWYVMFGGSVGNASAGTAPWTDFTWDYWSAAWEIGFMPDNVFGLGSGVYRVQPFVARAGGPTQGGLCFNFQQQLGENAPYHWFGRFGFGGSKATAGASAQIGSGFVMQGPLAHAGLFPSRKDDTAGIGFVWSQPSAGTSPVAHENEYILEAGYVLQLTPTTKLQPDLQVVWNPTFNPAAGTAVVFQVQLDMAW